MQIPKRPVPLHWMQKFFKQENSYQNWLCEEAPAMIQFKTAYVVQATNYDFEPLKKLAEFIKFLTTGYESDDQILETVGLALVDFDPEHDILVPVGNVLNNVLAGIAIQQIYQKTNCSRINLALYREKRYDIFSLTATRTARLSDGK
jgi:hypothetical protein